MAAAAKKTVKTMKAADLFVRCLEPEGVDPLDEPDTSHVLICCSQPKSKLMIEV